MAYSLTKASTETSSLQVVMARGMVEGREEGKGTGKAWHGECPYIIYE